MIKDQSIIDCALTIAKATGYPVLINDLQPVEDYAVDGEMKPGLMTKCERELAELREAFAEWQSGGIKTAWHCMGEASDIYYYSRQIERQSGRPYWPVMWQSVRLYLPMEWGEREVAASAHSKYEWRSKGNKGELHEIILMQQAVANLSQRGRKHKHREATTRLNFVLGVTLRQALQRAKKLEEMDDPDISLSEILEREALKSEYLQQLLKEDQHA